MNVVLFCHSLVSDWNHGNAHFLRGVARELIRRGHTVRVFEPRDGWSRLNLVSDQGPEPITSFRKSFPDLLIRLYDLSGFDPDEELKDADLVLVHEWNDPGLIAAIGRHHAARGGYILLFHDTHHRSVSDPEQMAAFDLSGFDGVLAFGEAVRRVYLERGWTERAWTWHEAADVTTFQPQRLEQPEVDVVWIGNWGDDERTDELEAFLLGPVRTLRLSGRVYGVRYPGSALAALAVSGFRYRGWMPNYRVPEALGAARFTVHVPRRPYVQALAGVPTIRVFEALATGTPLLCSPWQDVEGLFTPGRDYLVATDSRDMTRLMARLIAEPELGRSLAENGLRTILARHTCAHRVDQLLEICGGIGATVRARNGRGRGVTASWNDRGPAPDADSPLTGGS